MQVAGSSHSPVECFSWWFSNRFDLKLRIRYSWNTDNVPSVGTRYSTHRVYRVPGFLFSRLNWVPRPPRECCSLPLWVSGGRHSLAGGGGGRTQFWWYDRHSGIQDICTIIPLRFNLSHLEWWGGDCTKEQRNLSWKLWTDHFQMIKAYVAWHVRRISDFLFRELNPKKIFATHFLFHLPYFDNMSFIFLKTSLFSTYFFQLKPVQRTSGDDKLFPLTDKI
jgi:hypothetical protein